MRIEEYLQGILAKLGVGEDNGVPTPAWRIEEYLKSIYDSMDTLKPTDEQVEAAVSDWLDDHPEATTTVEDGAISRAKLNDDLKAKTDAVPELKSAFNCVQDFAYYLGNVEYSGLLHTGKYCRYTEYNGVQPGELISVSTPTNGVYTDLIPLYDAAEVSVHTAGSTGCAVIAFYDSTQTYISGVVGEGQTVEKTYKTTSIPANAKYVRFSGYSSSVSVSTVTKCYVGSGNNALLESAIRRKAAIQADTDLNNLKDNGFYLLYTGYTYTNAPSFYSSGQAWLIVYDMISSIGNHFRVQLFMKSNLEWAARRCSTVEGVETWFDWSEYVTDNSLTTSGKAADAKAVGDLFADTMKFDGKIQTDTDLNNITDAGAYLIYSGHTYTNAPAFYESGSAWLFVMGTTDGLFKIQLFYKIATGSVAYRTYNTTGGVGTWGNWRISYNTPYAFLKGKKISIVGDSISTYKDWVPNGYAWYYPQTGKDVDNVNKTWWKEVIDTCGLSLVTNASWSGSWVCYDDYVSSDSAKIAYTDARINALADGDTKPDIIVVLIGTNDFIHDGGNPLGTLDENTELPGGATPITDFRPAYATMIDKIRTTYPDAHVYCCTLIQRYRSTDTTYPIKNGNGDALALYNKAIIDISTWMGCNLIRLDTAISLGQVADYTIDGTLHPNAAGMKLIANEVIRTLVQNEIVYVS